MTSPTSTTTYTPSAFWQEGHVINTKHGSMFVCECAGLVRTLEKGGGQNNLEVMVAEMVVIAR